MLIQSEFSTELRDLKSLYEAKEKSLKEENKKDEAIFEKIKYNVCDIFSTLFDVSHKKSYRPNQSEDDYMQKLYSTYTEFFENIPRSWKDNLKKAQSSGDFEEAHKEEIKLQTLDKIISLFNNHYDDLKGDE